MHCSCIGARGAGLLGTDTAQPTPQRAAAFGCAELQEQLQPHGLTPHRRRLQSGADGERLLPSVSVLKSFQGGLLGKWVAWILMKGEAGWVAALLASTWPIDVLLLCYGLLSLGPAAKAGQWDVGIICSPPHRCPPSLSLSPQISVFPFPSVIIFNPTQSNEKIPALQPRSQRCSAKR